MTNKCCTSVVDVLGLLFSTSSMIFDILVYLKRKQCRHSWRVHSNTADCKIGMCMNSNSTPFVRTTFVEIADPVHELPTSWGTKLRTGGLAVILMRAGLKIDKLAFVRAGKVVLRLALFPMLFEALVDAGSYYW